MRVNSMLPATALSLLALVPMANAKQGTSEVPAFWVRPGFKVTIAAENFGQARFIEFDDKGHLYVSQPDEGSIKLLVKEGTKYVAKGNFVSGYKSVHGLDFHNGWLWFTTSGAVWKAPVKADGTAGEVVNVLKDLPQGGHWWRSILVDTDGFFTSIGDPGNITDQTKTDREKIWKYSLDGSTRKLWSSGIRNTEKLRYKPGTKELYGADHGSDDFGSKLGEIQGRNQPVTDYNPPCEFNKYVEGGFYGHPFLVGDRVPRIEYQNRPDILELAAKTIPPAFSFGAHWAPNGWAFVSKSQLGPDFDGDVFAALHGSWNRSIKGGYQIERILFDKVTGEPYGGQMIVGTLDANGKTIGRPVDVTQAPDGTIVWSDDHTNRIYRIQRVGSK